MTLAPEMLRDLLDYDSETGALTWKRRHTSGAIGVAWDRSRNKWMAYIGIMGRLKSIGRFSDFDAAVRARKKAERELGYHENHGRAG